MIRRIVLLATALVTFLTSSIARADGPTGDTFANAPVWNGQDSLTPGVLYRLPSCDPSHPEQPCYVRVFVTSKPSRVRDVSTMFPGDRNDSYFTSCSKQVLGFNLVQVGYVTVSSTVTWFYSGAAQRHTKVRVEPTPTKSYTQQVLGWDVIWVGGWSSSPGFGVWSNTDGNAWFQQNFKVSTAGVPSAATFYIKHQFYATNPGTGYCS